MALHPFENLFPVEKEATTAVFRFVKRNLAFAGEFIHCGCTVAG